MSVASKTALVTGANSGLGFEAAAQLADAGWGRVVLACRSLEKASRAREQLVERTGRDTFDVLAVDVAEVNAAKAASDQLAVLGARFDLLLLNAAATRQRPQFSSDGVEITYASTLVGHHVMTMRALADDLLTPHARIVIAGSEGARGNLPGLPVHDVNQIASARFGGDRVAAIEALLRLQVPEQTKEFVNNREYVTAKLIVAWWAAALARKLPDGMTANAVSPGGVASTDFARDASAVMHLVMVPMMKVVGPFFGMNGSVEGGAARYIAAASFGDDQSGHFYATAHRRKIAGPIGIQTWPSYFLDQPLQEAGFDALARVTGVDFPSV